MNKLLFTTVAIVALAVAGTSSAEDGNKGKRMGHGIKKADINNDGAISRDEFMKKHNAKFSEMDKDNDGNLSKDELKSAREKMKARHEKMREKREKFQNMTDEEKAAFKAERKAKREARKAEMSEE